MLSETLTPKAAKKRYFSRMAGASLGYLGAILGAAFYIDKGDPVTPVTILVSAIPAAFVLLMMRAVWRYIGEVDEVARHDYTQSMMAGLFGILAISSSWGLIEMFNTDLPRMPVFWMFPIFFGIFGLYSCFVYGRKS